MAETCLALVAYQGQVLVFEHQASQWQRLDLKEEPCLCLQALGWHKILQEIRDYYNQSGELADISIYFWVEAAQIRELTPLLTAKTYGLQHWHLMQWPLWLAFLSPQAAPATDQQTQDLAHLQAWVQASLLPQLMPVQGLASAAHTLEKQAAHWQAQLEHCQQEKAALAFDKAALIQEVAELRQALQDQQAKAVYQPTNLSLEGLVTYLPIIYKEFWSTIRPDELALLASSLQVPEVPSPIREPSAGVIEVMKKRLQALPPSQQTQIRAFCQSLPKQPQVRAEMAFFFN